MAYKMALVSRVGALVAAMLMAAGVMAGVMAGMMTVPMQYFLVFLAQMTYALIKNYNLKPLTPHPYS